MSARRSRLAIATAAVTIAAAGCATSRPTATILAGGAGAYVAPLRADSIEPAPSTRYRVRSTTVGSADEGNESAYCVGGVERAQYLEQMVVAGGTVRFDAGLIVRGAGPTAAPGVPMEVVADNGLAAWVCGDALDALGAAP